MALLIFSIDCSLHALPSAELKNYIKRAVQMASLLYLISAHGRVEVVRRAKMFPFDCITLSFDRELEAMTLDSKTVDPHIIESIIDEEICISRAGGARRSRRRGKPPY